MKTSRRSFLASVAAAIAGRALVRKPQRVVFARFRIELKPWVPGGGSLFNPRENLAAQYKGLRFNRHAFTLADSEFERGFASLYPPALRIGAPFSVPRPRREAA